MRLKLHGGREPQRGQALPIVALALVVLLGFVGLALDVGQCLAVRRELVRLSDAAALAGASALSAPPDVPTEVRRRRATARALEYMRLHRFVPDAPGHTWSVTFPVASPPRKLVEVETSRPVPLAFLPLLGIAEVPVSSGPRQAEAAPVDVVIVQDVSTSQLAGSHCMDDERVLVHPDYPGSRERCDDIPESFKSAPVFAYDPARPTTHLIADLGPHWPPPPGANVPWIPFAWEQSAARHFVGLLDPTYDQVAVVGFSGGKPPVKTHQPLTPELDLARAVIGESPEVVGQAGQDGLSPNHGASALAAGIAAGLATLAEFPPTGPARDYAIGTIILLSDGAATADLAGDQPEGCRLGDLAACYQCRWDALDQAREAASRGVVIYTVFVGGEAERDYALLLQYIADLTDDRVLDGDYTGSRAIEPPGTGFGPAFDPTEVAAVTGNYYRAGSREELEAAYDSIFDKIYTRLTK